jgi:hypothetical protein
MSSKQITNQFKRKIPKGPRIICKYCKYEIGAIPRVGITERRAEHLKNCTNKPQKPDSADDETESVEFSNNDYADIVSAANTDKPDELVIVLPSVSSM